jgi:hypothetical protein
MTSASCIWRSSAFTAAFGDPYLENTELEGGKVSASVNVLVPQLVELAGT